MYGNNGNRPINGYQGYFQQPYQTQAFQQYQQYQQPQPQQQVTLSGRPVTSREEAAGMPMDFTAGAMYMPDLAHGVIYAKIFNANTGEAPLLEFRVAKPEEPPKVAYATALEVETLRNELARIKEEIQNTMIGKHSKGGHADE